MSHVIVVGAGPLGRAATHALLGLGHEVTVATRSGTNLPGARHVRVDVVTGNGLDDLPPAEAVVACCNFPYTAKAWRACWPPAIEHLIQAAATREATLVVAGNLYANALRMPMRATDPLEPATVLGEVRARVSGRLFAAHDAGQVRGVEVRGSDYFGPDSGDNAHLGRRFFAPLLAGRPARIVGDPDAPHTWTAVQDFGRLLARAATDPTMSGRAWHVPSAAAMSRREVATRFLALAGLDHTPRLRPLPGALLTALGWFSPTMRAVASLLPQFTTPYLMDDQMTRDLLGETHTPVDETLGAILGELRQPD
ncbi:NADP oxidoreductase [Arachnia propionica]|uniref:NADP oxidoreductase n=1 Tax=Arachnia propionica TaxID=1750 RepID=A0A3P1T5M3_9ACTN|nr:NAD-dependent epimerase/dehydratase family protein [Arachnia propionica]RRD04679.1 NADP oxidoreductase [Arachnia propionica]